MVRSVRVAALLLAALLGACGGGAGGGSPEPLAPTISRQPQPLTVARGESARFAVQATGSDLRYQWQIDGRDVEGGSAAAVELASVSAQRDGSAVRVRVSNSAGSVVSEAALLRVTGGPTGTLELISGDVGGPGNLDGQGADARFTFVSQMLHDGRGGLWLIDQHGASLRRVDALGAVSTLLRRDRGSSPQAIVDGDAQTARLSAVQALSLASNGKLYVFDRDRLRRIDADGRVTSLSLPSGAFANAQSMAADVNGGLVLADRSTCRLSRVDLATLAETTLFQAPVCDSTSALSQTRSMVIDAAGDVYIATASRVYRWSGGVLGNVPLPATDTASSLGLLSLDPSRRAHVLLDGSATVRVLRLAAGQSSTQRTLARPDSVNIINPFLVDDAGGLTVLRARDGGTGPELITVAADGSVRVLAGRNEAAHTGVRSGRFALDRDGRLRVVDHVPALGLRLKTRSRSGAESETAWPYADLGVSALVADSAGELIGLYLEPGFCITGYCSTLHGVLRRSSGSSGSTLLAGSAAGMDGDGPGAQVYLAEATAALAIDTGDRVYLQTKGRLRRVAPDGTVSTLATDTMPVKALAADGADTVYAADAASPAVLRYGAGGTRSVLYTPTDGEWSSADGVAVDPAGNVYVSRCALGVIDRITPAGHASRWAGVTGLQGNRPGPLPGALDCPTDLGFDAVTGRLYIRTPRAILAVTAD
jgi:sugar lactone lactonase YvrE